MVWKSSDGSDGVPASSQVEVAVKSMMEHSNEQVPNGPTSLLTGQEVSLTSTILILIEPEFWFISNVIVSL